MTRKRDVEERSRPPAGDARERLLARTPNTEPRRALYTRLAFPVLGPRAQILKKGRESQVLR